MIMKIFHRMTLTAASLFFAITSAHALDGDAKAGEQASAVCVACHQSDGSGMNVPGGESWPSLAGLNAKYLYTELVAFKSGARQSPTMTPFASMLDEQQAKDIAAYYSQLPAVAGKFDPAATEEELAHGEKLATEGDWDRYIVPCSTCHGPGSLGAGDVFPRLAGQHAGYISDQLHAWQSGRRDNDPQHLMLAIAERMNEEDIRAVSEWLARQPAQ